MKNTVLNDSLLKIEGMNFLIEKFGEVDAERFISLLLEEPFDYTQWQRELFSDKNVDDLFDEAAEYFKKSN